ncbi:MAG: hypothetical protein ABEL51_01665 [Salinibacter sp.]
MNVWIVSSVPQLRESLHALLTTCPEVTAIHTFGEIVHPWPRSALADRLGTPDLIVVSEEALRHEPSCCIGAVKGHFPRARCLALLKDAQHRVTWERAGVDEVLIQGWAAERLMRHLRAWMADRGRNGPQM